MAVLKLLLILALVVFPLGALFRINLITSSYIYPLDILLFLILVLNFYFFIKNKRKFSSNYIKIWAVFIGFAFFTLVINYRSLSFQNFLVAFLYLARFILYSNLLIAFRFIDAKFSNKYRSYLAFSGFIPVLLGYIQYFFYPNLKNLSYLGWDDHLYRMFSTFLDPNFAGSIFVLEFILLLGYLFQKNILKKKLISLGLLFTLIAIFLTYSRSTFLMLISAIVTFLILTKRIRLILIFALFFILIFLLLPKNLRSEGVDLTRTASIVARQDSYRNALTIFRDSPIFGIGFNAYRYSQEKHGFLGKKDWETTHSGAGVSNSWLFVLATTGIIGVILYIYAWFGVLRQFFNNKNQITKAIVVSSIAGLFIHSFFENSLFYPFVMFWIFSLIGSFKVDT